MSDYGPDVEDAIASMGRAQPPATLGEVWDANWQAAGLDTMFGQYAPRQRASDDLTQAWQRVTGWTPQQSAQAAGRSLETSDYDERTAVLNMLAGGLPTEQQKALAPYLDVDKGAAKYAGEIEQRQAAVNDRAYGLSGHAVGFMANMTRQLIDPSSLAGAVVGGPEVGGVGAMIAREFAVNAGFGALQHVETADEKARLNLPETSLLGDAVSAGLFGTAIGLGMRGAGFALRRAFGDTAAPRVEGVKETGDPAAAQAAGDLDPADFEAAAQHQARNVAIDALAPTPTYEGRMEARAAVDQAAAHIENPEGVPPPGDYSALDAERPAPAPASGETGAASMDAAPVERDVEQQYAIEHEAWANKRQQLAAESEEVQQLSVAANKATDDKLAAEKEQQNFVLDAKRQEREYADDPEYLRLKAKAQELRDANNAAVYRYLDAQKKVMEAAGPRPTRRVETVGADDDPFSVVSNGPRTSVDDAAPVQPSFKPPTAGAAPQRPQSLLSFLTGLGGVKNESGELSDLVRRYPGLVNNKRGLTLDQAREAAAEAGYFGADVKTAMADTTPAHLTEALRNAHERFSARDFAQLDAYEQHGARKAYQQRIGELAANIDHEAEQLGLGAHDPELSWTAAELMHADGVSMDDALDRAATMLYERDEELRRGREGDNVTEGESGAETRAGDAGEGDRPGRQGAVDAARPEVREPGEAGGGAGGATGEDAGLAAQRADVERALAEAGDDVKIQNADGSTISARDALSAVDEFKTAARELAACIMSFAV